MVNYLLALIGISIVNRNITKKKISFQTKKEILMTSKIELKK